ncbi:MAG: acetyl-coenzyme A synthetase, partial [Deltaproteobacteria bacterium]
MSDPTSQAAIDSVLKEHRVFPPPEPFSGRASVPSRARYDELYRRSLDDPEAFWGEMAARLRWTARWERVLDWQPPFAKWFVGGRLNIADNCLDRHLAGPRRNKAAIVWEGEPGDRRVLTYHALHREVCRFSNVLKGLGVKAGDRVGIYLPMIPEAAIAMLACARIGATHSVVFGGFSAEALRDRMNDAEASVLVTADGGYR